MKRLRCWFNRHSPRADEARWDGLAYCGTCEHCGTAIKRRRKGVWVKDRNPSGL